MDLSFQSLESRVVFREIKVVRVYGQGIREKVVGMKRKKVLEICRGLDGRIQISINMWENYFKLRKENGLKKIKDVVCGVYRGLQK